MMFVVFLITLEWITILKSGGYLTTAQPGVLKLFLLHNGNGFPSIPVAHSVHLEEDYENVKLLLEKINYNNYNWDVCSDFKTLGFLLGLQGGFTKYSCFLCLWDSRAVDHHFYQ